MPTSTPSVAITPRRARRLYRIIIAITRPDTTWNQLVRIARTCERTLYRDIDVLRELGVIVEAARHAVRLVGTRQEALQKIPFPVNGITYGDVISGAAQEKIARQFAELK